MKSATEIGALCWPTSRVGECVTALLQKSKLGLGGTQTGEPSGFSDDLERLIDWHAERSGCEAESIETTFAQLENALSKAHPALLKLESGFLAILDSERRTLRVLAADLAVRNVRINTVCAALRAAQDQPCRPEYERVLAETDLAASNRAQAVDALWEEQIGSRRFDQCWLLRVSAGATAGRWLGHTGVWRYGTRLVAAHSIQYAALIAAWAVLGKLSLATDRHQNWVIVWAVLLMTLVPFRVISTWLQGQLVVGVGGALKRRLLCGALRLKSDEVRHKGVGSFFGQALEAEVLETLALSGGIAGVLALIELTVSGFLLGRFALLLGVWIVLTGVIAWRFLISHERWIAARMQVTGGLIEAMVGHRTRLVQQRRENWHHTEDLLLENYLAHSRQMDGTAGALVACVPRGWLIVGLACLTPAVGKERLSQAHFGVVFGGLLLAYAALKRLTGASSDIAAAWVAWRRIAPLFHAAARLETAALSVAAGKEAGMPPNVLQADSLSYSYRQGRPAVLRESSFTIRRGERVLLEGSSGGGKSTLASLLAGLRQPDSGCLRLNGRTRLEMGDDLWRKQVVTAPQFHENHILAESLAFNLLLGRNWPPMPDDLKNAETICRELGLGALLDRMPSGLMQMVGEGGWQLSHGERSRIFLARAILQNPELTILDESFGALDPENLKGALEYTLENSSTLMVIAHP